jgi:hypothetical protein
MIGTGCKLGSNGIMRKSNLPYLLKAPSSVLDYRISWVVPEQSSKTF